MKKLLIAIDDSPSALKAVEYVAKQFGGSGDLAIGLVHVLPNLPALFWDEGHILSDDEKKDRKKVVDKWLADRRGKMEPIMKKAADTLAAAGIGTKNVTTKFLSDSTDVADSLVEEARDNGYQTIVMGRHGNAASKRLFLGNVTSRLILHSAGMTVTVVE